MCLALIGRFRAPVPVHSGGSRAIRVRSSVVAGGHGDKGASDHGGTDGRDALINRFTDRARLGTLDLDLGAALIGSFIEPARPADSTLAALDRAAAEVTESSLTGVLSWFRTSGFEGDRSSSYTSPLNSSIGRVLDERVGIPISLSVVLIEIARRRGVVLSGVNMPGHFLLRADDDAIFVDAYSGAALLDRHGAERLHQELHGVGTGFHPSFLAGVTPERVLLRMLNNLRLWAAGAGDLDALRWILRLMDSLDAGRSRERHRLGRLLAGQLRYVDAATELEALAEDLSLSSGERDPSEADFADSLREEAAELRSRLN